MCSMPLSENRTESQRLCVNSMCYPWATKLWHQSMDSMALIFAKPLSELHKGLNYPDLSDQYNPSKQST